MGIDIWEVVDAAGDQALRLHALRARPRDGRPLPAGRSVLPDLARAGVPHVDRVHRAGGQDQPVHARTTAWSGSSARSTTTPSRSRAPGSRSSASATRAASATSVSRPALRIIEMLAERGAELVYHDPYVPALPDLGLAQRPARRGDGRRGRGRARHRPSRDRSRRARPASAVVHRSARRHPRPVGRQPRPPVALRALRLPKASRRGAQRADDAACRGA